MATASISLIREQSEAVRPPRALWVPFALGRPLGSANDPEFQKAVMRSALHMLDTATEPTIEDYPIEAPAEASAEQWACPVNFPVDENGTLTDRLLAEVARLAPWSAETRASRGRTLFGVTGAGVDQVEAVARTLGAIAEHGVETPLPDEGVPWSFDMPLLIRHLADDLRTYYHEAIAAQPGPGAPNHAALNAWIFGPATGSGGTALGETLLTIAQHLSEEGSLMSQLTRGFLIPEGYYERGSAFPVTSDFGNVE